MSRADVAALDQDHNKAVADAAARAVSSTARCEIAQEVSQLADLDVIIIMLPDSAAVKAVLWDGGLVEALFPARSLWTCARLCLRQLASPADHAQPNKRERRIVGAR